MNHNVRGISIYNVWYGSKYNVNTYSKSNRFTLWSLKLHITSVYYLYDIVGSRPHLMNKNIFLKHEPQFICNNKYIM